MKKNAALLLAFVALTARPALAADKQHLQMMAEIRLLQEQQQQLQQLIGGLQDTLKTLNAKLDDQAAASRKALADQTLAVNTIGDNVRVLREKTDDTNVRISSVSQEIDALRQSIAAQQVAQQPSAVIQPGAPTAMPPGPSPAPSGGVTPTVIATPTVPVGVSPARMFDSSYNDYTAGRWDLAISGFQEYIASFPTSPQAADAQYNIGQAYYNQSKWPEARDAYQKVISVYGQQAQGSTIADAYYKLGLTYERLNQVEAARQAYQTVVQKYPNTLSATQAANALQRLNRR